MDTSRGGGSWAEWGECWIVFPPEGVAAEAGCQCFNPAVLALIRLICFVHVFDIAHAEWTNWLKRPTGLAWILMDR